MYQVLLATRPQARRHRRALDGRCGRGHRLHGSSAHLQPTSALWSSAPGNRHWARLSCAALLSQPQTSCTSSRQLSRPFQAHRRAGAHQSKTRAAGMPGRYAEPREGRRLQAVYRAASSCKGSRRAPMRPPCRFWSSWVDPPIKRNSSACRRNTRLWRIGSLCMPWNKYVVQSSDQHCGGNAQLSRRSLQVATVEQFPASNFALQIQRPSAPRRMWRPLATRMWKPDTPDLLRPDAPTTARLGSGPLEERRDGIARCWH